MDTKTAEVDKLLPELLEMVFRLLPRGDLKVVVLVCRRWREVGEEPVLWAWVCLRVDRERVAKMPEMLVSRRLQAVDTLEMTLVTEEVLQAVLLHRGLRTLYLLNAKLLPIDTKLVVRVVTKVEVVRLYCTQLTTRQVEGVMKGITGNTGLRALEVLGTDLSMVEPQLLASALTTLERVNLSRTLLTQAQVEAVMEATKEDGSRLRELVMGGEELTTMDPLLLGPGLAGVEEVSLLSCCLLHHHLHHLLTSLHHQPTLRRLVLEGTDMSKVEAKVVALVTQLEEVSLHHTGLTQAQAVAIFTAITTFRSTLRRLMLVGLDLASVPSGLVARAMVLVEEVELVDTCLTREQVEHLLSHLCQVEGGRVRRLRVGQVGGVDGQQVARARRFIHQLVVNWEYI